MMSCASLSAAAWAAVVTSSRDRSVAVTTWLSVGGLLTPRVSRTEHATPRDGRFTRGAAGHAGCPKDFDRDSIRLRRLVVLAEDHRDVRVRGDLALAHGAARQAQGLGDLRGVLLVGGVRVDDLGRGRRGGRGAALQEGEAAVEEDHAGLVGVALGAAGVLHGDPDGGALLGALGGAAEDVLDHAGAGLGAEGAVVLDGQQGALVVAALGEV